MKAVSKEMAGEFSPTDAYGQDVDLARSAEDESLERLSTSRDAFNPHEEVILVHSVLDDAGLNTIEFRVLGYIRIEAAAEGTAV